MITKYTYMILIALGALVNLSAQTTDTIVYNTHEDTSRIVVTKCNLNSYEEDFCPAISNNKILFTSSRISSFAVLHKEPDSMHNTNIYYAEKKDSLNFSNAKLWPGKINTYYNEGSATLNKDETLMIFTGNNRAPAQKNERNSLCLYASEKINNEWQEPKALWFCNSSHSYCHPALNRDGKIMFFSSDIPGSIGGMDIYFSRFENGKWSTPRNVGPGVNTSDNELFPSLSNTDILYFSSNRKGGRGGLDIYSVDLNDSLNTIPVILEEPINSAYDDFSITPPSDAGDGYFSSSRNPKSKDDIFYYRIATPDFSDAKTPDIKKQFCYNFFEETSMEEFDTNSLQYEWKLGDSTILHGANVKHCYNKPGTYQVQLNIIDKSTGVLFYNQVNYDHIIPEPEQLKIECVDLPVSNQKLRLSAIHSSIPGYDIEKFYWNFGDNTYNSGKLVQHIYKTPGNYTITLGVIAKSRNTGEIEKFKLVQILTIKDNS